MLTLTEKFSECQHTRFSQMDYDIYTLKEYESEMYMINQSILSFYFISVSAMSEERILNGTHLNNILVTTMDANTSLLTRNICILHIGIIR